MKPKSARRLRTSTAGGSGKSVRRYGLPYPLVGTDEIIVMDKTTPDPDPRFPLLGLNALRDNNLKLFVDGERSQFELFES